MALEPSADERGWFARTWCAREFAGAGLESRLVQCSLSSTPRRGTLRGLHYQATPHAEAKLIRCLRGAIFDAIVDLRPGSPSYRKTFSAELSAANRLALFVPAGCAHGFQTLTDDCEVWYQMSEDHHPESVRGIRWDDPAFAIAWPVLPPILSARDAAYPDFAG